MGVWLRTWTNGDGSEGSAWCSDFRDATGRRVVRSFNRKSDAQAFADQSRVDTRAGLAVVSNRLTLKTAADRWLAQVEADGRERTTLAGYRQHVAKHIILRLGDVPLSKLTEGKVEQFRDCLLAEISRPMARKVLASLKACLKHNKHRAAAAVGFKRDSKRHRAKLEAGTDIPLPEEINALLSHATGLGRTLLAVGALTGLRASELRGLRWKDIDGNRITVRQRADRYCKIGSPKSATSSRSIPIDSGLASLLREWKIQCPAGDLVFPTGKGTIENHSNIIQRVYNPAQVAAGVVGRDGKAKYNFHALRHFYASLCINPKEHGGLGLSAKVVQERLGHATIAQTLDTYGHLFPSDDDGAELAAVTSKLLATKYQQNPDKVAILAYKRRKNRHHNP